MKLIRCQKCGTVVVSNETFLQNILDAMEETCHKARRAKSGYEKQILLHEAAEYKTMYKAFMHHLTRRDEAERNVSAYVVKELYHRLVKSGRVSDEEFQAIQQCALERAAAVRTFEDKQLAALYGNFQTACNRTMPNPTERAAIKTADREERNRR